MGAERYCSRFCWRSGSAWLTISVASVQVCPHPEKRFARRMPVSAIVPAIAPPSGPPTIVPVRTAAEAAADAIWLSLVLNAPMPRRLRIGIGNGYASAAALICFSQETRLPPRPPGRS